MRLGAVGADGVFGLAQRSVQLSAVMLVFRVLEKRLRSCLGQNSTGGCQKREQDYGVKGLDGRDPPPPAPPTPPPPGLPRSKRSSSIH